MKYTSNYVMRVICVCFSIFMSLIAISAVFAGNEPLMVSCFILLILLNTVELTLMSEHMTNMIQEIKDYLIPDGTVTDEDINPDCAYAVKRRATEATEAAARANAAADALNTDKTPVEPHIAPLASADPATDIVPDNPDATVSPSDTVSAVTATIAADAQDNPVDATTEPESATVTELDAFAADAAGDTATETDTVIETPATALEQESTEISE